ncbi:MAG: imidazole glycerol phosphate synthase subunit HisH [Atopobiaceae bacterium]|nr:imidazole glycerol phosphate synthase subunit HisH [Atopobiaceae bacterium]
MAQPNIAIVDYHKGNLLSVVRSLNDVGAQARATDDPALIRAADAVVVPGVGAFEDCMDYLRSSGEADAIVEAARRGVPFLGICLGLHVLFERGEERSDGKAGEWVEGLGILSGSVTRLQSTHLKVPHVGWDQLHLTPHGRDCVLYQGVAEGANVYFTHSYALADDVDDSVVTTRSHYTRSFASGVWSDNVFGVQFHPEKSSATGLAILRNFVQAVCG